MIRGSKLALSKTQNVLFLKGIVEMNKSKVLCNIAACLTCSLVSTHIAKAQEYSLTNISQACGENYSFDLNDAGNVLMSKQGDWDKVALFNGTACFELPSSSRYPDEPGFDKRFGFTHFAYDINNANQLVGEHAKTVKDPSNDQLGSKLSPFGATFSEQGPGRYVDLTGISQKIRAATRAVTGENVESVSALRINDELRIAGETQYGLLKQAAFSLLQGRVVVYPPPNGFDRVFVKALNNQGQIAASLVDYDEESSTEGAFIQTIQPALLQPDGSVQLAPLPTGFVTADYMLGMNEKGDLVGTVLTSLDRALASYQAVVWHNSNGSLVPTLLGKLEKQNGTLPRNAAFGINDCGDIIGQSSSVPGAGILWRADGTAVSLRSLLGEAAPMLILPSVINNQGQVLLATHSPLEGYEFQVMSPKAKQTCNSLSTPPFARLHHEMSRKQFLGAGKKKQKVKRNRSI